jgi:hypothetical protein
MLLGDVAEHPSHFLEAVIVQFTSHLHLKQKRLRPR